MPNLLLLSSSQEVQFEGLVKGHQVGMVRDPPERHVVLQTETRHG